MDSVPQPPLDGDLKNIIDKLAQFVARNGPEFETMTKNKQKGNPKFQFLYGGEYYHYYMYKVNAEQAISRQQQQQQWGAQSPQGYPGQGPPPHQSGWGPRSNPNSYGYNNPTQDQSWGNRGPGPALPPTPMPPQISYPPPQIGNGAPSIAPKPKPLMAIQATMPPTEKSLSGNLISPNVSVPPPIIDTKGLMVSIEGLKSQQKTIQEQITQSESNLAAQQTVTMEQTKLQSDEAISKAKWEHLELLSADTGVDLEEMETVIYPIIESCTKESISGGKVWIFSKATNHDNNRLIAHYLAYRVTQESASFTLRLHLIYLMNDVLHHCVRKYAEELKQSLESVAVEMFCAAWTSSANDVGNPERESAESRQGKLSKLIKLWEDKAIFSPSTLNKMRSAEESWKAYSQQLKLDYADAISKETSEGLKTYDQYAAQHQAFVSHAQSSIINMEQQIKEMEKQIQQAEQCIPGQGTTLGNRHSSWDRANERNDSDPPPPGLDLGSSSSSAGASVPNQQPERTKKRSSRWDTGQTEPKKTFSYGGGPPIPAFNQIIQHGQQRNFDYTQNQPPPIVPGEQATIPPFSGPPPFMNPSGAIPDLSRPPPGFALGGSGPAGGSQSSIGVTPTAPPTQWGPPPHTGQPPSIQLQPALSFDENSLIPSLPYYDLPAGLMIPLVKKEDSGYKPLNPKEIRLPPPTPPTERLLAALEQFYAPPSHERPRDPEGFEMLGLYEWSKEKSNAVKTKTDDIEMGRRDRSPTDSPEPYGPSDDSREATPEREYGKEFDRFENKMVADRIEMKSNKKESTPPKRKRYRSETPERVREKKRHDDRSRSRTRSRSRGSTPDRSSRKKERDGRKNRGSFTPSPSPPGGYTMPSYLTRRSPSPGGKGPNRRSRSSSPARRNRRRSRSVSPEGPTYAGFGSAITPSPQASRLDSSNKGHQMLLKMGYSGSGGLGKEEGGIDEPISGGEVRDKTDMFRGVGMGGPDAFEMFRKNKAGTFYKDQRQRRTDRKKSDR